MVNNKEAGMKAENHVMNVLNNKGIRYDFIDDWYDIELLGQKVEIKSCRMTQRQRYSKKQKRKCYDGWRIGRFEFTSKKNREKQFNENIWVLFVVRHHDQFIILGLIRAKALEQKQHVTIHKVRELGLTSLDDWIRRYNK